MAPPRDDKQPPLLDLPADWEGTWEGMAEFRQDDQSSADRITVHFETPEDRRLFLELLGENPARQKSIWFPRREYLKQSERGAPPRAVPPNRYPIYIISKGRWESRHTARALDRLCLPYRIVVEPQEAEEYARVIPRERVLELPFSNLGQGSIPARNWVWEHAAAEGHERYWILDDNIDGFYRLNRNTKARVVSENPFTDAEAFADRYLNVALAGLQYEFFACRREAMPPYRLNTRIYSCILILTELPDRWRGRYNEDTDLSLRLLKQGWCTVLFNHYLAKKLPTMTVKGGNTDELYRKDEAFDGRLEMARSLQEQHPDVVKITRKWNRWQHVVDYTWFKRNKLVLRPGCAPAPEELEETANESREAEAPAS